MQSGQISSKPTIWRTTNRESSAQLTSYTSVLGSTATHDPGRSTPSGAGTVAGSRTALSATTPTAPTMLPITTIRHGKRAGTDGATISRTGGGSGSARLSGSSGSVRSPRSYSYRRTGSASTAYATFNSRMPSSPVPPVTSG